MQSRRRAIAGLLGLLATSHTASAEMSTGEKMMEAAAIVLGAASQQGGTIVVQSADDAILRSAFNGGLGLKTTFRRLRPCVYVITTSAPAGLQSQYQMIDFSKLTGAWRNNGDNLQFPSVGTSHCSSVIGGCWQNHARVIHPTDRQQIVDDVAYLLRHGCGESVPSDADPH